MSKKRLVVGITGSSGVILGIRLLQALRDLEIESHLVLTSAARLTIEQETDWRVEDVLGLADVVYAPRDIGAAIASGSFSTQGMLIMPCSVKTLSAVANSFAADLVTRAADVTLKEGRPLVLVVRETPLHRGHLRLMMRAVEAGAVIFPPVPAFYTHPQTAADLVENLVGRVLARMGIENQLYARWNGPRAVDAERWPPQDALALPAMTLATSGADGNPHAAAVYFAADGHNRLFFFSEASSQHARDLSANPRAAVTIQPHVSGWQEIRGLQLRGTVNPVPQGEQWEHGWQVYQAKFPFVAALKQVVASNTLYAFTPNWIRLLDNRRGFGFKDERILDAS